MGGQLWDPVSLEDAPGAGDGGIHRRSGELGPGTRTSKSVVDKYRLAEEKMDKMTIRTRTGLHKISVREEVQDSGIHLQSGREDAGQPGWEDAECEQRPGGEK